MGNVHEEVKAERERQVAQWGGPEHDDTHSPVEWMALLQEYLQRARDRAYAPHGTIDHTGPEWRKALVQVAALAIAAAEAADRQQGA